MRLTMELARAKAGRGAAHLDRVRPGWFNQIDVGKLEMINGCKCIIGQLHGGNSEFFSLVGKLFATPPQFSEEVYTAWDYGLCSRGRSYKTHWEHEDAQYEGQTEREIYALLQAAWVEIIAMKRFPLADCNVEKDEKVDVKMKVAI